VADAMFEEPRLAEVYDAVERDRGDLGTYLTMVAEFGARSVLDIGSGTGTFACLLAAQGLEVTGVDPAGASVAVARKKPGAHRVCWVVGDASALPPLTVELVTMTGNVAQVFLTDREWKVALSAAYSALRPGGRLVFETRNPTRESWQDWTREQSYRRVMTAAGGVVSTWVDLTEVSLPFVSFRTTFVFETDGATLTSSSTLRFRSRSEIEDSLGSVGFVVDDVREASDRPGRELVFVARKSTPT
jgi:ubiquinone/menaquinone biosynthesis C-methylase UbiE